MPDRVTPSCGLLCGVKGDRKGGQGITAPLDPFSAYYSCVRL
jgi:hypothetical protein